MKACRARGRPRLYSAALVPQESCSDHIGFHQTDSSKAASMSITGYAKEPEMNPSFAETCQDAVGTLGTETVTHYDHGWGGSRAECLRLH